MQKTKLRLCVDFKIEFDRHWSEAAELGSLVAEATCEACEFIFTQKTYSPIEQKIIKQAQNEWIKRFQRAFNKRILQRCKNEGNGKLK